MPTYEYACENDKCQHCWEAVHSMKADPVTECPKCKEQSAKRLISGSAFVLKGGGWASTNYS
jgi:putative FmdB family regulatory protein